jgi:hypothetical protein
MFYGTNYSGASELQDPKGTYPSLEYEAPSRLHRYPWGKLAELKFVAGVNQLNPKKPKTETIALRWPVANKKKNTQQMQFIFEYKVMWI